MVDGGQIARRMRMGHAGVIFVEDDTAAITIVNNDTVDHRAGPFLVGAGQTYTQRFPEPGQYAINCSVNAAESITVTVEG